MYQGTLEAQSNKADWFVDLELIDDDTGLVVEDLSGVTFKLVVRQAPSVSGYTACSRGYDDFSTQMPIILSAVSGDQHVTVNGGGVEFHFTSSEMSTLSQGNYLVGVTATRDGVTTQELIANLPIIDGVV